MSSRPQPLEGRLVDPGAELSVGGDDFSVRVEHRGDPRFWVRIERDTSDGVVVTDFTPGDRPEDELEAGLLRGIEALQGAPFSQVVFRDLVPGGDEDRLKIYQSAGLARRLATFLAESLRRPILDFTLVPRRDKLDAVARYG
jgi:hypothetical protein